MLSVVTVTRNNAEGFKRTSESIICQVSAVYEWIIVDGGDGDEIPKLLSLIKKTHPFIPIRYCRDEGAGPFYAMNKGLGLVAGDRVIFLNSGDSFVSRFCISEISKTPASSVTAFSYKKDALVIKPKINVSKFELAMPTCHQAIVYPRYCLESGFDTTFRYYADNAHFQEKVVRCNMLITYVDKVLVDFEPGGLSDTMGISQRLEQFRLYRKFGTIQFKFIQYFIFLIYRLRVRVRCPLPRLGNNNCTRD